MTFHIITLFPSAFRSYLGESILKRAIEDKKIAVKFYNPRDFVPRFRSGQTGKATRIDKRPYGGGPGMVIQALPVIKAIESALSSKLKTKSSKLIWLTPNGKQFTNQTARKLAGEKRALIIICGRYEGIDARVKSVFKKQIQKISVGPFVLTGGELPAMVMIDTIARQIPGVLGDTNSPEENRIASHDVYTRPEVFKYKGKNYRVPKILLSGHHQKIENWKLSRNKLE